MRHQFRFFGRRLAEEEWSVLEEEHHHMLKVLRLQAGACIELINGAGYMAEAVIEHIDKRQLDIVINREHFTEPPQFHLELAIGALRSQSFEDLLPCLVELGVRRIVVCRLEKDDKARIQEKLQRRWRRIADSALKQCKRSWAVEIQVYASLSEYLESAALPSERWLLNPAASSSILERPLPRRGLVLAVGSEAGWSQQEEMCLGRHGFDSVTLGQGVLRAYTASIASVSCVAARLTL